MKYLLDTDTLIYFLKGKESVVMHVADTPISEMATSIINQTELLFGAFNSLKKKENLKRIQTFLQVLPVIPFCDQSSYIFAEQKALLTKQGTIIADLDLMIASIALRHQFILVTNNLKHFTRIKKLKVENWAH